MSSDQENGPRPGHPACASAPSAVSHERSQDPPHRTAFLTTLRIEIASALVSVWVLSRARLSVAVNASIGTSLSRRLWDSVRLIPCCHRSETTSPGDAPEFNSFSVLCQNRGLGNLDTQPEWRPMTLLFAFIDESGNPHPNDRSERPVLASVCLKASALRRLSADLYRLKRELLGKDSEVLYGIYFMPESIHHRGGTAESEGVSLSWQYEE